MPGGRRREVRHVANAGYEANLWKGDSDCFSDLVRFKLVLPPPREEARQEIRLLEEGTSDWDWWHLAVMQDIPKASAVKNHCHSLPGTKG